MSDFDNREKAFETKYAADAETRFRIEARAVKLIGLWAGQEMGLSEAETNNYAATLVTHNLKEPGLADVTGKVSADLAAKGKPTDTVESMMEKFLRDAEEQLRAA